ncbi:MAG: hypothetical protein MK193_04420 [Lentisphaeria bacterium]|nr:hypothetical protein [Lentisphaeria bacterium]
MRDLYRGGAHLKYIVLLPDEMFTASRLEAKSMIKLEWSDNARLARLRAEGIQYVFDNNLN